MRPALALVAILVGSMAQAQAPAEPEPPMSLERMGAILRALDPETRSAGPTFQLTIEDIPVTVVADPAADRMRAMVPIRGADGLDADELRRLMQANFDSALDARYAVANGVLWGVFIHPLSPLERDQLISGVAQTVNVAKTYGTLYSGGAVQFGGGDSNRLQRDLLERLLKRGEDI